MDYVDRLKTLGLYSQERRRERYQVLFLWKVGMAMVEGYNVPFTFNPRTGWHITPSPIPPKAPAALRRAREASLAHKGAKLFNLLPRGLRDMATNHIDDFKVNLDTWLATIPDEPTVPGRQRAAATNSLLDWVPMLGGSNL